MSRKLRLLWVRSNVKLLDACTRVSCLLVTSYISHEKRRVEIFKLNLLIKYKPIFASSYLSWGCSVQVQWWPARAVQPAPHTNVAVRGVSAPLFSVATWRISPFEAYLLRRATKQKRLCVCPPLLSGAGWHETRIFQPRAGNYPGWRCSMMMVAGPGGGANTAPWHQHTEISLHLPCPGETLPL